MYIMLKAVYPHNIKLKVGERYLKLTKDSPPNPALKCHSVHTENGKLVNYQFEEVAPENLGQKMAELMKAMMQYDDIEGFEYEIKGTFSAVEALKLIE